jgi:hypothetical protein
LLSQGGKSNLYFKVFALMMCRRVVAMGWEKRRLSAVDPEELKTKNY